MLLISGKCSHHLGELDCGISIGTISQTSLHSELIDLQQVVCLQLLLSLCGCLQLLLQFGYHLQTFTYLLLPALFPHLLLPALHLTHP